MLQVQSFIFSPIQENTYLLFNEFKHAIVIDPGCYFDDEKQALKSRIIDSGLTPLALLNTHCHLDHVFGNKFIHDIYGLPLYLHRNEQIVLEYAPASGVKWGLPFENYSGPFHFLAEGDVVRLGADELEVLFTPGHAPGHISFYCKKQSFVISGDVLFNGSIGRTDLPLGDFDTLIGSIKDKLFVLPENVTVYPGHGGSTTILKEKTTNPYLI